ncbi:hypothetical protein C7R54_05525 [Achromobacter aloeverae]|uniref:Anti sigma-E protein RseA N-terminal domain-containing protein n=2 Tax=Achromobacter aloeverae TaxID=1750518 RepID=A0A4Q1HRA4_9BURK|nr:hypothetical protein C7R54_05525 [Achromobacter aloeverae]
MDGEGSEEWLDGLDVAEGRETWDTYHLIGDVLRNAELAIPPSAGFRARLAAALDNELTIVAAPRKGRFSRPAWRLSLSGAAMAAAVASVVWVAQPLLGGGSAPSQETRVIADATPAASAADEPVLRDYLEAHMQMAGPSAIRQVSFDLGAGR